MLKKLSSIIIIFVIILASSSCYKKNEIIEITDILEEQKLVEVDNYGRILSFSETPTKVLTLGPNCTELFVALGLGEYVIGRSLVNHSKGPLDEYATVVDNIPQLNYAEATREAILTSGADFIYAIDWEISDYGCNIEEVEKYGINVYVNSAKTLEEQYKEILDIGKIFGIEERANEFVAEQKTRISNVKEIIKNEEPLDVLVYDSGSSGVFTATGSNFETILINEAGGNNIFSDIDDKQWATVSYEDVLEREPDVILIHDYDTKSVEEKIIEIKSNPAMAELDCVINEKFVFIPLENVLPGNRMAYTVEYLAKSFYPTLFEN